MKHLKENKPYSKEDFDKLNRYIGKNPHKEEMTYQYF